MIDRVVSALLKRVNVEQAPSNRCVKETLCEIWKHLNERGKLGMAPDFSFPCQPGTLRLLPLTCSLRYLSVLMHQSRNCLQSS